MRILLLISLTITTLCDVFKFEQPGNVLQEGNIRFDLGCYRVLKNVGTLWVTGAQTVDSTVTVQVCQYDLVEQLHVRAKEHAERIQA